MIFPRQQKVTNKSADRPGVSIILGPDKVTVKVSVIGASDLDPNSWWYQQGIQLGKGLGQAGFQVYTGGYGGMMEAVSAGARAAGAKVFGVTVPSLFPHREGANRYVKTELNTDSLFDRLEILLAKTDALIAMPGSLGTATELLVGLNLKMLTAALNSRQQEGPAQSGENYLVGKPILVVGDFWMRLLEVLATEHQVNRSLWEAVPVVTQAIDRLGNRLQKDAGIS